MSVSMSQTPDWGLLPADLRDRLQRLEWDNSANFRIRLDGTRKFPIEVSLRAPTGPQTTRDPAHYLCFVQAWRQEPMQSLVKWETTNLRGISAQEVPVRLTIDTMESLAGFLGAPARQRFARVRQIIDRFRSLRGMQPGSVVRQIIALEALDPSSLDGIEAVVPQLCSAMGTNRYLRALPLRGVDTKFVEQHEALLFQLLVPKERHAAAFDLDEWLGVQRKPNDWLVMRPLCPSTAKRMFGITSLRVGTQSLLTMDMPALAVLVVENEESVFSLPTIPNAIAIGGSGRNLSWLAAPWAARLPIGYWGDLDTWGFCCLADARKFQPGIQSLMMDVSTLRAHQPILEPEPTGLDPRPWLTASEHAALDALRHGDQFLRLEQERLSGAWIHEAATRWINELRFE